MQPHSLHVQCVSLKRGEPVQKLAMSLQVVLAFTARSRECRAAQSRWSEVSCCRWHRLGEAPRGRSSVLPCAVHGPIPDQARASQLNRKEARGTVRTASLPGSTGRCRMRETHDRNRGVAESGQPLGRWHPVLAPRGTLQDRWNRRLHAPHPAAGLR